MTKDIFSHIFLQVSYIHLPCVNTQVFGHPYTFALNAINVCQRYSQLPLSRYQVQHHASIKNRKIGFGESLLMKWTKEGKKKKQSMILANLSSMLGREYKICKKYRVLYLLSYALRIKFPFFCFTCLLYIASRVLYIPHLASGALKIRYIFTFGCTINVFSVKTALIIVRKYIIIHVVIKGKERYNHPSYNQR